MVAVFLPEFVDDKGNRYTIDERLHEFRRVFKSPDGNLTIEFIPFNSDNGKDLIQRYNLKIREVF